MCVLVQTAQSVSAQCKCKGFSLYLLVVSYFSLVTKLFSAEYFQVFRTKIIVQQNSEGIATS